MATGEGKVTFCHPLAVSAEKVALPRSLPDASHRFPTCVPVFSDDLKKRMPVTLPATDERNFTPSSTELGSPWSWSAAFGVTEPDSEHGQDAVTDVPSAGVSR